jgi:hypothetical protein
VGYPIGFDRFSDERDRLNRDDTLDFGALICPRVERYDGIFPRSINDGS